MATMKSQASSSSSSLTCGWKHDVFINFRGEDIRRNFMGHLHKALLEKEVKPFLDEQDLEKGKEINPALIKAIQESRIALVIFSENYAGSTFCLEELAKIMECSEKKGMLVYPVFFHVKPAEVRYHQKGSYAKAFAKHEGRNHDKQKLGKWKLALEKAANLLGWIVDNDKYEHKVIEEIVQYISIKISSLRDSEIHQGTESIVSISNMKPNTCLDGIPSSISGTSIYPCSSQPNPQSSKFNHEGSGHLLDNQVPYNKGIESTLQISNVKPNTRLGGTPSSISITSSYSFSAQPNPQSSGFNYGGGAHLPDNRSHCNKQSKPESFSFTDFVEYLPDKRNPNNKISTSFSFGVSGSGGGGGSFLGAGPYPPQQYPMMNQQRTVSNNTSYPRTYGLGYGPPLPAVNFPNFPLNTNKPPSCSIEEEESDDDY